MFFKKKISWLLVVAGLLVAGGEVQAQVTTLTPPPSNGTIFSLSGQVVAIDQVSRMLTVKWSYLSKAARISPNPVLLAVPESAHLVRRGVIVNLSQIHEQDWITTQGRFNFGTPTVRLLTLFAVGRR